MNRNRILPILAVAISLVGLLAGCVVASESSPASPAVGFKESPASPVMVGPMAGRPAIGDVNRDGKPDVVVACGTCCGSRPSPESGHINVLLGDGKGGFDDAPGSPMKVGPSVRKVAIGDLDRDGDLDIVAAEHDTYRVTVLMGDGTGRFNAANGSPFTASEGGRPHTHEIALGDMNADGTLDILTTNANDGTISLLLGDGKGTFTGASNSPIKAGRHPYDAIEPVDVNLDGHADIVVPDLMGNGIAILLNDGKGTFAAAPDSPIAVANRPAYLAVGDLNSDGKPDVCVTHDDLSIVDVLLGDGTGRFVPAEGSPFEAKVPLWGIEIADVDADRNMDVVLGSFSARSPVVMRGDGKGSLALVDGLSLASGSLPNYVAVADLNLDGRPDIVTGNYGSGDLSVHLATLPEGTRADANRREVLLALQRDHTRVAQSAARAYAHGRDRPSAREQSRSGEVRNSHTLPQYRERERPGARCAVARDHLSL